MCVWLQVFWVCMFVAVYVRSVVCLHVIDTLFGWVIVCIVSFGSHQCPNYVWTLMEAQWNTHSSTVDPHVGSQAEVWCAQTTTQWATDWAFCIQCSFLCASTFPLMVLLSFGLIIFDPFVDSWAPFWSVPGQTLPLCGVDVTILEGFFQVVH